jgi:ribosome-associated toxin RatA of RatAB toxin-antitoxin module
MIRFKKTLLAPYSAQQLFQLVDDVRRYPEFLPWCAAIHVIEEHNHSLIAQLDIKYLGLKQSFSTINTSYPNTRLTMQLKQGLFKYLIGEWIFTPIDEHSCQIIFSIEYDFENKILQKLVGPVFDMITKTLVDAFIQRAQVLYPSTQLA